MISNIEHSLVHISRILSSDDCRSSVFHLRKMLAPKTPRVKAVIMAVGSSMVSSFTWGRRQEAGGTEGGRRDRRRRRQEGQKEKEEADQADHQVGDRASAEVEPVGPEPTGEQTGEGGQYGQ